MGDSEHEVSVGRPGVDDSVIDPKSIEACELTRQRLPGLPWPSYREA